MDCWVIVLAPFCRVVVEAHAVAYWEEHAETRATRGGVAHLEAAAMRQYDRSTNCQTEPVTRHFDLPRAANERLENAPAVLSGDAGAFVLHSQLQFTVTGEVG
jgi:hypothetical protein